MARIPLDLIPQDYRRGKRGNPYACLLEKAAERQYGVKLKVGGSHARERGVFFPRTWSLDGDAQQVVGLFDSRASQRDIFHGRSAVRVHLRGKPLAQQQRPVRSRPERRRVPRHSAAIGSTAVVGSMALIGDGLAWIVITAVSVILAALAAVAGARIRREVRARSAVMPGYAAQPAVPEPAPWRSRWPEQAAAPAPPQWPERVPVPALPAAEPDPPRWPGPAPVPDEVTEPAVARGQVPQPAWPDVPGYDPRAQAAGVEPVRSR
jgi:hypothetical protein